MESLQQIFADVLVMVEPKLKREGITVKLKIQPSSLKFKKQHVQLILLDLVNGISEMIGRVSFQPGKKVLDISGSPSFSDGKKMVLINFQFPADKVDLEEGRGKSSTIIGLSQELARVLGGEVICKQGQVNMGEIELLLPS